MTRRDDKSLTQASFTFDSWSEFQEWISKRRKNDSRFIYRGHDSNLYRLDTTFHREGRRNIYRYRTEDIPELYRNLAPILTHQFNLNDPIDYLAFLFFARHHGFPTPLIDWTESHYVASFFAFFSGENRTNPPDSVRILEFDLDNFESAFDEELNLTHLLEPTPILKIVDAVPFANPRAHPQQSKVMFSNVANVEHFVSELEKHALRANETYVILNKIDLKYSIREEAINYLRYIGITPATMFPGFDGVCKALKQKFFNR